MTSSYIPGLFPPRQPEELIFVVREAVSGGDRRNLARLLSRIYRGDRYGSPPSRRQHTRVFSPKHNPSLQGLLIGLFVAEARNGVVGDEIVGGIAVWTGGETTGATVAHFGMFEAVNNPEVGEALIEAAEFWLMERSPVEALRGPFSLDAQRAPGLLVDGFNVAPGPFLPYNPPYYPEMIEHAGYEPASDAYAFILSANPSASTPESVHILDAKREPEAWVQFVAGAGAFERAVTDANPGAIGLRTAGRRGAAGLILIPGRGGSPRGSRWRGRLFQRRGRRLLALSVGEPADSDAENMRRDLYGAAARHAYRMGIAEILCAPIPARDTSTFDALASFGARKAQTYRIYEKRF